MISKVAEVFDGGWSWRAAALYVRLVKRPFRTAARLREGDACCLSYETLEESLASVPAHPIEHPRLGWIQAQARATDVIREEGAKHNLRILRPVTLAYIETFGAYSVGFEPDRDFRAHNPDTRVYIDGNTGELKNVFLPRGPAGKTFTNLIVGLHFADFHGWQACRLFVFVFGFLICMLSVTGVYVSWKKRRVRKSRARSQ